MIQEAAMTRDLTRGLVAMTGVGNVFVYTKDVFSNAGEVGAANV